MNAAFVRTMHKHFDRDLGRPTLDKIWDPGFTSLQIPGTTKNNSMDMDTAYGGQMDSISPGCVESRKWAKGYGTQQSINSDSAGSMTGIMTGIEN